MRTSAYGAGTAPQSFATDSENWWFDKIRGILPRDLFVNVSYYFLTQSEYPRIKASRFTLNQLCVPEAARSAHAAAFESIEPI